MLRKFLINNKIDILVLQATRIEERKAIELAIDVIGRMQYNKLYTHRLCSGKKFSEDSKIVLVMAGLLEAEKGYKEKLKAKADKLDVNLLFINEIVEYSRCEIDVRKCYSLWDVYIHADLVPYPSILEGWENQFF